MSQEHQKENKKLRVSFSQYSKYLKCPMSWKLDYLDGKRKFEASLNMCFGTAIHNALQTFIKALYTEGLATADSLDVFKLFKEDFKVQTDKAKTENTEFAYTDDEYTGFIVDGEDILKTLLSTTNRRKYFPSNKYELVGIELPLELDIKNNISFVAFVDLVLKDKETGKIYILDFKTSASGWNKYMQIDPCKTDQLLLYKAFYSKQYSVPLSDINVEFFILKRKLFENASYPQSRIQLFSPNHNKSAVIETLNSFTKFVDSCFNKDGSYNTNGEYPMIAGKAYKNCKYCQHRKVNCFPKKEHTGDMLED